MPIPLKKFKELTADKSSATKVTIAKPKVNLSQQCPLYTNWMTDKYGRCKRMCMSRSNPQCPAKGIQ